MPSLFEPILKSEREKREHEMTEHFEDQESTGKVVGNTFIGISLMTLAMLVTWLFIWGYSKDKSLFIAFLNVLVFIYAMKVFILILVIRDKLSLPVFRIYMGSALFMIITSLVMIILFSIKASKKLKSNSGYVPSSVQEYINPAQS